MVNNYANAEMAKKHFLYGLADGTMREASCRHQEQFSGCTIPERGMSGRIH
jgi:hypothetical protein